MLNADQREIILQRRCRADERGLFLSLSLATMFNYVNEYGSNKIELYIFGHTNIGDSDVGHFTTEFYPGDYYFKHNNEFTPEVLLISKCQGFKIENKYTKMGLYLKINPINNTIDFYDAYYYKELSLSDRLLDNDDEVFVPFYLGNVYGNKIPNCTVSTLMFNSSVYALDIDPVSRIIKGVIGQSDVEFSRLNSILIRNDDNLKKHVRFMDELIDNFSCTMDGRLFLTDKENNEFYLKYQIVKSHMREIRRIESDTHISKMLGRVFYDLEDISKVQSDISSDVIKKKSLLEEVPDIQNWFANMRYKEHLYKIDNFKKNNKCKYYSSLCLLIKNENEYIEEWLEHYCRLGVDHFYIYDNGSTVPVKDYLATIKDGYYLDKCTFVDFSKGYKHMQYDCYENCLLNFGNETFWLGFVDTDEFIDITCGNINTFLKDFENDFCIWIPWEVYNSAGHILKPNGSQKDNYNEVILNPQGLFGKVILQPYRTKKMYVHLAVGTNVFDRIVNSDHSDNLINTLNVRNAYYAANKEIYKDCRCRHYFTRSLEEWMNKISRGSCDPNFCRKFNTYFDFNPRMRNNPDVIKFLEERQEYITYIQQSK